jgi:uncharacterized membrane protein
MTIRGNWTIALLAGLGLSLCLNLFVAGLLVGRGVWHPPPPHHGDRGIERFFGDLPDPARHEMRSRFDARKPEMRERFDAMRAARDQIAAAIRAPELDEDALRQAFAELRARNTAAQALMHDIVIEAVRTLPPEVRAEWEPRWRGRRHHRDRDDD